MQISPRRLAVLLFDDFSNLCLANTVEPFRAANTLSGRALYQWEYLALQPTPVCASSGLPVQPGGTLAAHPGGDLLFVMPSYGAEALVTPALQRGLRAAAGRFQAVAGLDSGAWLLAASGLLDGRRATIHWDMLDDFAEGFPAVEAVPDRFVLDPARPTCGGATAALDLSLALIEAHHGALLALDVAALFMQGPPPAAPLPLGPDTVVRAAAAVMRRHIEEPLPIAAIAARVGLSQRRLAAVFARALGRSPTAVYRRIRLAEARRLVTGTRLSIAEIAARSGYADPAALTRAFRLEFGAVPTALRR